MIRTCWNNMEIDSLGLVMDIVLGSGMESYQHFANMTLGLSISCAFCLPTLDGLINYIKR